MLGRAGRRFCGAANRSKFAVFSPRSPAAEQRPRVSVAKFAACPDAPAPSRASPSRDGQKRRDESPSQRVNRKRRLYCLHYHHTRHRLVEKFARAVWNVEVRVIPKGIKMFSRLLSIRVEPRSL
jgi:hypothetical protein